MKRNMKSYLILLAAVLLLPFVLLQENRSSAAEILSSGGFGENLTWVVTSDDVLTISGTGDMDEQAYLYSNPWSRWKDTIRTIVIGEGVTSVGFREFTNLGALEQVTLPSTLQRIEERAFAECEKLEQINFPDGLLEIGKSAFEHCVSLKDIALPAGLTTIRECAFSKTGLTRISLPDSVTQLEYGVFMFCADLASVSLPANLSVLGDSLFRGCDSLTAVDLPNTLISIGSQVFGGCINLAQVIMPEGISVIDFGAFEDCRKLAQISLPSALKKIGTSAFNGCASLSRIDIPASVEIVEQTAFANCTALAEIRVSSVIRIKRDAFKNTAFFSNAGQGVVYIGKTAYVYKGSMEPDTQIVFNESTVEIAEECLAGQTNMTSVVIPRSVTYIGKDAFLNSGLKNIYYKGTQDEFVQLRDNSDVYISPFSVFVTTGYHLCKYCGQEHTGAFGSLISFIHSILYFFRLLFK